MKHLLFLLPLLTLSCENLRHATNISAADIETITNDWKYLKKLDQNVALKKSSEVKKCRFVAEYDAKDNVLEQGRDTVVYYLKHYAYQGDANTIVLGKIEKVGDYGHRGSGKAYVCP